MSRAAFTTIRTEGGILPADLLSRIAALSSDLEAIGPEAYHLAANERLGEAITRSWNRLVGAWSGFKDTLAALPATEPATSPTRSKWLLVLFQELGYGQLQTAKAIELGDKSYPISHAWGAVPLHLVGANVDLDRRSQGVVGAASATPHGLLQEALNRSDERLWGFVSNGRRLRVLRDNAALTRQAFVEFDLEAMFDGQQYADFAVLWLVCHESRVEGAVPEKYVLERWMADAAQRGTRALDHLRDGVEAAITELGAGFLAHPANADLRDRLRAGELSKDDYQRQLLRVVYRLLFLLVAESRELLLLPDAEPSAVERFKRFYSMARLRSIAEVSRGGPHGDLWRGLSVVFDSLGRADGLPALGLPALGSFLWSAEACVDLDGADLANRDLLAAVRSMSSVRDGKVTRSVDYRNLGAEELGSIYESLLELHPDLDVDAYSFRLTTAAGHERKTTGSYYTPSSLVSELLDSALEPVIDDAAASANPEDAILALTVFDPACGSGHFLIAAGHRIARRLASIRTGEFEPAPSEVRTALRDVVGRCLYGVDVNPMAVELCKVSLWMEAVEPGRPLSFLDHHIVRGNSLLGATPALLERGVPDEAFRPIGGDERKIATAWRNANKRERSGQGSLFATVSPAELVRPLAVGIASIDAIAGDDAPQVHEQERRFAHLQTSSDAARAKLHADAWCAAFVAPKANGAPVITDAVVRRIASDPTRVEAEVLGVVRELAAQFDFLHLHLAFPTVFRAKSDIASGDVYGWDGGFSVVLGNPPWDQIQYDPQEAFASSYPEIANAPTMAKRNVLISRLAIEDPSAHAAHEKAVRRVDGLKHFLHASGRYPLGGVGRLNTAPLFVELMWSAVASAGQVGVITPTSLATDSFTQSFFQSLVRTGSLVSLLGFENEAFVFPGIHHATKFCLLTLAGASRTAEASTFVFFARSVSDLADDNRRFTLDLASIDLLNPNTGTAPIFRTKRDADISSRIYKRIPILVREAEPSRNDWRVEFQLMFMMNTASHLFRTASECAELGAGLHGNLWRTADTTWLPLYEGKMVFQYEHRYGTYTGQTQAQANVGTLPRLTASALADPTSVVQPRYWLEGSVVEREIRNDARWLLGFRDVTSSVSERTMIAAIVPATACGHKLPLIHSSSDLSHCLLAVLNSFCLDYIARQKVGGTSMTFFLVKQLAVPPPSSFSTAVAWSTSETGDSWFAPRILELTYTAWDLEGFGREVGYLGPPFRWDLERRELLRVELDAACFHLYGLDRDDVDYVMETFPIVKRKDEKKHGEYRTKRLILEVYDAMAKAIETGEPYQTILDPSPADPLCAHPESTRPDWAKP
jgi:hypothetical protein